MSEGYSPVEGGGLQRTDMHCHACSGNFVAELDYDLNGDHEIVCPRCGHIHYRTIKDGKITESRYGTDSTPVVKVDGRSIWSVGEVRKRDSGRIEGAKVSTVSHFLRDRWLNRSDFNGS
jgi:uncharacterized Zn finger protein